MAHSWRTRGRLARAKALHVVEPAQIAASLAGDAPVRTVEVEGVPVRVIVLRTAAGGKLYAIAVGIVISDLIDSLNRVRWLLVLVWIVSTVATAAVGFALASTALRPVSGITQRAMEIAKTDLRARLEPPQVKEEIGLMTESLNTLIERLHVALDANRRFAADAAREVRSPVTAIAGEIEVTLRRERSASEYKDTLVLVQNRLAALSSLIRISDTGPGIPDDEREHVFDRFHRIDQSRNRHAGGAGLGLAIAREVLALFKGTIHIEQSAGRGTTVQVQLPGREQHDARSMSYASVDRPTSAVRTV